MPSPYPMTRHDPSPPVDLSDEAERDRPSSDAARAFFDIALSSGKRLLKVFALCTAFLFPYSSFAEVDVLFCPSDGINRYNKLEELIERNPEVFLLHNIGFVALCIGKHSIGLGYLQQASDAGYIASTHLLGIYFKHNQTFSRSEKRTESLQDLNAALEYYRKAADLIDSIPDYPNSVATGVNRGMDDIEYYVYTSYYVFATIPELYFRGYDKAMEDMLESAEKVSYIDTSEVLSRMQSSAERCLRRPSLSGWWDKEKTVYEVQQFRCRAYLNYATAVLPLEEERAKAAGACEVRLSECEAHRKVLNDINQLKVILTQEINSLPEEFIRR